MRITDFHRPGSLQEARAILKRLGPGGLPVAGGTSLVFTSEKDEKVAVDINRLGLEGIRRVNDEFHIGAATRLVALQKHHEAGWVLDRVAVHLASQQIRNMSTLGGNIARVFPWADFPVALLALGAVMVVMGDAERGIPADEFFSSQPARLFQSGDLLAAVKIPALGAGQGFGYSEQTQTSMGFSLVTAAAMLEVDGSTVKSARVAVGAGVPFPCRVAAVEQAIIGKRGNEQAFKDAAAAGMAGLKFKSGADMSEEFIGHLAQVAVADALTEAWTLAKGGPS